MIHSHKGDDYVIVGHNVFGSTNRCLDVSDVFPIKTDAICNEQWVKLYGMS